LNLIFINIFDIKIFEKMSEPNAKRRKVEPVEAAQAVQALEPVQVFFNAILAEEICPCGVNISLRTIYYKMKEKLKIDPYLFPREIIESFEYIKDCHLCSCCMQKSFQMM